MAIRPVLKMGDPRLIQVSEPIKEFNTQELNQLIQDMLETMEHLNGAGLAAPQIGVLKRIMVFGVEHNPRYPDIEEVPQTVLINPEIEFLSDDTDEMWEGCLSVPGMRGNVERCTKIRYRGFDPKGNVIERVADDFHARVVQHEYDHLDGILYPMRIKDMRQFGFEEALYGSEL